MSKYEGEMEKSNRKDVYQLKDITGQQNQTMLAKKLSRKIKQKKRPLRN